MFTKPALVPARLEAGKGGKWCDRSVDLGSLSFFLVDLGSLFFFFFFFFHRGWGDSEESGATQEVTSPIDPWIWSFLCSWGLGAPIFFSGPAFGGSGLCTPSSPFGRPTCRVVDSNFSGSTPRFQLVETKVSHVLKTRLDEG